MTTGNSFMLYVIMICSISSCMDHCSTAGDVRQIRKSLEQPAPPASPSGTLPQPSGATR